MKIVYGKLPSESESLVISTISAECGILYDTARLLFCRGIDTVQKAKSFLNAGKNGFNNPYLFDGMKEAVERITRAKDFKENVFIFGDYDADGVCATAVLYNVLRDFGINARKFVPEREDNYGLNLDTVSNFNQIEKIDLLITVDCGISDGDKIEELKKWGIDVIVTDHHEPPQNLPNCIKINPKISGQKYPFASLCGAGVAYKLGYALVGKKADTYLDFVALATVADSMDLVEENRDIVVEGLKLFNNKKTLRSCFKYLIGDLNKQVTAQTLAYNVAPRVNAGGRMGDAETALKLFTEEDENKIFDLATRLGAYNVARQAECDKIYREAKAKIENNCLQKDQIILVADEGWRTGFIGIVAAKLVEDYAKPVVVFAGCDGYYKGSARSVEGFNIYDAINSVQDLLITFGGHSQAAGVSVSKDNFNALKTALNDYVLQSKININGEQKVYVEWEIDGAFSIRFAKEIELLEPCGVGNRRPLFSCRENAIESMPLKIGSPHYSFTTKTIEILDFNGEKNVYALSQNVQKSIIFEVNLSSYKNRESLKGYLKNVVAHFDDNEDYLPYKLDVEMLKYLDGKEVDFKPFYDKISIDREDFKRVYAILISLNGKYFNNAVDFCKKYIPFENTLQSTFVVRVFLELGIFSVDGKRFLFNEKVKNALTNSQLYSKIYSLKVNV